MKTEEFQVKSKTALRQLFDSARTTHELYFAFALIPEQRGLQDAGWNGAEDLRRAYDDYMEFLESAESNRIKIRIALAFYCHLAEASGYYEIPKNMLRVAEGMPHILRPFDNLVREHSVSGNQIAPNANKILKDLAGHSQQLGFNELAEVFRDAFDPDIRNGYAHADYVVWENGVRFPRRNGGPGREIVYEDFHEILNRGIGFFHVLQDIVAEYIESYSPGKNIRASLGRGPEENWQIEYRKEDGSFYIGTPQK